MEDDNNKIIDKVEKEALEDLETLHEDGNEKNESVIDDSKAKIETVIEDAKEKIHNNNNIDEIIQKAMEQIQDILDSTRQKAIELSENEQFKKAALAGKEFIENTGILIGEQIKVGVESLKENDTVKEVWNRSSEKLDELRDSDTLKNAVDKAEEVTVKVNKAIFTGLRKIFKDKEES